MSVTGYFDSYEVDEQPVQPKMSMIDVFKYMNDNKFELDFMGFLVDYGRWDQSTQTFDLPNGCYSFNTIINTDIWIRTGMISVNVIKRSDYEGYQEYSYNGVCTRDISGIFEKGSFPEDISNGFRDRRISRIQGSLIIRILDALAWSVKKGKFRPEYLNNSLAMIEKINVEFQVVFLKLFINVYELDKVTNFKDTEYWNKFRKRMLVI